MDKNAPTRAAMVEEARPAAIVDGSLDVVALAANLGLEVYQERLADDAGYIAHENGDTFIVVNSDDPLTRQRFTIAHEIGHYVNDFDELKKSGRLSRSNTKKYAEAELEADSFAASLLIPEKEAKDMIAGYDGRLIDATVVEKIAAHFNVSKTMAVQRLREIGVTVPYIVFA